MARCPNIITIFYYQNKEKLAPYLTLLIIEDWKQFLNMLSYKNQYY